MSSQRGFVALGIWTVAALAISFGAAGLDRNTVTRLFIVGYFAVSLGVWALFLRGRKLGSPRGTFVGLSLVGALYGEAAYMISRPLHPSLLVERGMAPARALRNLAVDWVLAFPAYVGIFLVIWFFATRYRYSPLSFLFVMGLGQALGDGNAFFLANPAMLAFLPYVMLNYWAMTFVPYLCVVDRLDGDATRPRARAGVAAHLLPLVALPITYLVVATIILTVGAKLGWLPASAGAH